MSKSYIKLNNLVYIGETLKEGVKTLEKALLKGDAFFLRYNDSKGTTFCDIFAQPNINGLWFVYYVDDDRKAIYKVVLC